MIVAFATIEVSKAVGVPIESSLVAKLGELLIEGASLFLDRVTI